MNLRQRFYNAVIDASDAFSASVEGVDVRTYRTHVDGHPDGIVAARLAGVAPPAQEGGRAFDRDESDQDWGSSPPAFVAQNSVVPSVRAHAHDFDDEIRESRWRDLDDADRSVEW
jgi:hypothetical protein